MSVLRQKKIQKKLLTPKYQISSAHQVAIVAIYNIMLPYSRGLILENTNNYGIVKTETLIGFGPNRDSYVRQINSTEPLQWIFAHENFAPRSLKGNLKHNF